MRSIISDFAVVIAIAVMTICDIFGGIKTPKLEVPHSFVVWNLIKWNSKIHKIQDYSLLQNSFIIVKNNVSYIVKPTISNRGWIIPLFGDNPIWTAPAALLPALFGAVLIFLDQQITALIVNRKENKLLVRF